MLITLNRQFIIKRYARFILALFVMSVINMSVQMPAHAAMQQLMTQPAMNQQAMQQMSDSSDMAHCKCPPAMCETVESLSDQSVESLSSLNIHYLLGFQSTYSSLIVDLHQQPSAIQLQQHKWQYRQVSPPPLSISSILHI